MALGITATRHSLFSAAPGVWTPAGLGFDADLWLEDSSLSTGAVASWPDLSGNGRTFSQGTAGNRPSKQADGGVLFDGSDDYLTRAYESWMTFDSTAAGYSQWTVHSRTDTTIYHALGVNRGSTVAWDSYLSQGSNDAHLQRGGSGVNFLNTYATGTVYLTGLSHDAGATGVLRHYRGTTAETAGPAVSTGADDGATAGYIGSRADGVTRTKGRIYMILCVKRSLTIDEVANLAAYANARWGASLT